jgi:hypothetical protein
MVLVKREDGKVLGIAAVIRDATPAGSVRRS